MGFEDRWLDDLLDSSSAAERAGSSLASLRAPSLSPTTASQNLAESSLPKFSLPLEAALDGGFGEFLRNAVILTDPRDPDK